MGEKINNFNTMMKNPKNRNIYLALAGVGLVTLGVGFYFTSKSSEQNTLGAGAQVAGAPTLTAIPGSSDSQRYNEMVQKNNDNRTNQALESNTPFVPTIVNNQFNAASPIDMLGLEEKRAREQKELEDKESAEREKAQQLALEALKPPTPDPVPVAPPAPITPVVAPVVAAPPAPVAPPPKYTANDYMLIGVLQSSWRNYPPTSEKNYYGQEPENKGVATGPTTGIATSRVGGVSQGMTQSSSANMAAVRVPDQKAGDIIHAVLDTGINSSEPSPILATVVSGQFKGAKLLGRFTKSGKKVVLQFNTISIPNYPTSTKLMAIAMDPDTRRSSMATDVDNHYFLRYGVLLASTFLSGYANAISNKNSTTTITPEGSVIQTSGDKTNKDINREALGSVGTELAAQTKSSISGLEPTIYVEGGTAIGILFMEDFFADGAGSNGSGSGQANQSSVGVRR